MAKYCVLVEKIIFIAKTGLVYRTTTALKKDDRLEQYRDLLSNYGFRVRGHSRYHVYARRDLYCIQEIAATTVHCSTKFKYVR